MLMLEESPTNNTLLAQSTYYAGLVGTTPHWWKINKMFPPAPYGEGEDKTLIGQLWPYLIKQLCMYWTTGLGLTSTQALAAGVQSLVKHCIISMTQLVHAQGAAETARHVTPHGIWASHPHRPPHLSWWTAGTRLPNLPEHWYAGNEAWTESLTASPVITTSMTPTTLSATPEGTAGLWK